LPVYVIERPVGTDRALDAFVRALSGDGLD
jgi:hypothetical protein